ncbi:MAG: hypothetical protein P794_01660 [Epsilonproteobacteria bacterium (ex Lamellibrachia satsuma)]|nr:MAG: hypothetical protein P794_01660 [Epsilonproteobacteria bacterium (ex Lamellibrachia satsuma)]
MKHNLGKRIALFIFFLSAVILHAEDFIYDFHVDTQNPYEKEAVLLSVDLNQSNPDIVLFFHFRIRPSSAYTIEQIGSSQDNTLHHTKIHYLYLLHPLKSGDINISFDLVKRITNDEKVAYSFSGDRDDFKKLETEDTEITLSPLKLHVKPLPKDTQLMGDFKLSYKFKTHQAEAFEPIPVQITLEGQGYPPVLKHIIPEDNNITVFSQKPLIRKLPTQQGIKYKVSYIMALSSSQSFDLKSIILKAFDPKTKNRYELTIPKQHFDIKPVNISNLVDKTNTPKPLQDNWSWLSTLLGYLIAFGAGYLTALSLKWKKRTVTKPHPLKEKIKACKDEKALLQLLMATDNKKFASSIEKLEKYLYENGKINLNKVKQEAKEKVI